MELDKAIQGRRSIRNFSKKKPDWREILECVDSARYAPMAGNCYSLRFILVDEPEKIDKIATASQQDFIKKAHYVVVVVSIKSKTLNSFGERAEKYLRQQAGAGIQNILLKIKEKGLATCWVGHFVDEQVKEILDIPEGEEVEAILPIGFEAEKPKTRKEKISFDAIMYFNEYGNQNKTIPKKLNV